MTVVAETLVFNHNIEYGMVPVFTARAYVEGRAPSPRAGADSPKSKSTGITINISVSPQGRVMYTHSHRSGERGRKLHTLITGFFICLINIFIIYKQLQMKTLIIICRFQIMIFESVDMFSFLAV